MRVWLYARLSGDDDPAQNSLQNQQKICRAFAEKKGWTIAGSSTDDNISGMNFSRRGLDMLTAAVQAKQVEAVGASAGGGDRPQGGRGKAHCARGGEFPFRARKGRGGGA